MENINYKYTNDGRKVRVVENLNQTELIVQEIFVDPDGVEIPSGERFVVKSLHDQPLESWKSREEKHRLALEDRFERDNKEFVNRIHQLNRDHDKLCKVVTSKISFLKSFVKHGGEDSFKLLSDFLTGKIKYLVTERYGQYAISGFNSSISQGDSHDFSELRLICLYGREDGSLLFRLNQYGDHSGNNHAMYPFSHKKDAVAFIVSEIDKKNVYDERTIKTIESLGLKADPDKLKAYKSKTRGNILSNIERRKADLDKCIKELDALDSEIEGIK